MSAILAPIKPPLTVFGTHVRSETTTLVVVDKMLRSGDDYIVRTAEGDNIVFASAKEWSALDRKVVYDDRKNAICEIRKKPFSVHGIVEAVNGDVVLLKAEKKGIDAFEIHIGDKITLNVSGEWETCSAEITLDSSVVAHVVPDVININSAEDLADAKGHSRDEIKDHRYRVIVAPGVDLLLMAVACICLDMTFFRTL